MVKATFDNIFGVDLWDRPLRTLQLAHSEVPGLRLFGSQIVSDI